MCCRCMGLARLRRVAAAKRGATAPQAGGSPLGGAWRGPAQGGSADQVDAGSSLSEPRPPTGSAVERLKGKASEIPLVEFRGTGRGGLKVLALA